MKITKLYSFHFTSDADGGTFAGVLWKKNQQQQTNGDHYPPDFEDLWAKEGPGFSGAPNENIVQNH